MFMRENNFDIEHQNESAHLAPIITATLIKLKQNSLQIYHPKR